METYCIQRFRLQTRFWRSLTELNSDVVLHKFSTILSAFILVNKYSMVWSLSLSLPKPTIYIFPEFIRCNDLAKAWAFYWITAKEQTPTHVLIPLFVNKFIWLIYIRHFGMYFGSATKIHVTIFCFFFGLSIIGAWKWLPAENHTKHQKDYLLSNCGRILCFVCAVHLNPIVQSPDFIARYIFIGLTDTLASQRTHILE